MTPRTTVTMPAYNAESSIRDAVESALAQTMGDFELLVVDDGSRVLVADVLAGITDDRLRIVRHPTNRGLSAARNTAVRETRTPLFSQLDADDKWDPGYLEGVLPCFEDPSIGLAYCAARVERGDGTMHAYLTAHLDHPVDSFPGLAAINPVAALTATLRTDAVRSVGGYAGWLWGGQDYHLYMKLAAAGWRFAYVDRELATYRWPDDHGGMSSDARKVLVNDLKLFTEFKLRHPRVPGPGRRVVRLSAEIVRSHTPLLSPAARAVRERLRRRTGAWARP